MDRLDELESHSIHILREAYAKLPNLCMLWSIGKDSTVLLWLARRTRPLVEESERRRYEEFVGSAFGRKGSTMHQCLRWAFTGRQIGRLTGHLRFERSAPPSTLSFDQWLGLFRFYVLERSHNYRKVV